jgi:hypothetical protein
MLNPLFRYASFMVAQETPDTESLRLELQEALAAFRHWSSQLTQTAGFVATGDVVLISYGFSQKLAAILLVASALPAALLSVYLMIGNIIIPLVGLILTIERKLQVRGDSLGATYMWVGLRSMGLPHGTIEDLSDEEVRRLDLSLPWHHWLWTPLPIILYAATIAQIGLFVLGLTVFHYRFM